MKIRSQFLLLAALFGMILLIIGASVASTTAGLNGLGRQAELAARVELAANDLNYLAGEYLVYGDPQQRERWEARDAELAADLAAIPAGSPEQQALIAAIAEDRGRLESVFRDVASRQENGETPAGLAALQTSWSRIGVQTQGLAFDAGRLTALIAAEADGLRYVNTLLVSALLGSFAVLLLANYLLVGRRTMRSVAAVQAGADAIGSGNLAHTIPAEGDDEVGDLARSFNRMAADLATVTASRAELEREVAERRRAEEALSGYAARLQASERDARTRAEEIAVIYDTAPVGLCVLDRDLRFVRLNRLFAEIDGIPVEEHLGRTVCEVVPGHGDEDEAALRRVLETGETDELEVSGETPADPGVVRYWDERRVPIRDGTDAIVGISISAVEVTGRKRAEAALMESSEKYRDLFVHDITGDFVAAADGRILDCNPAFARMFGFSSVEEALSSSIIDTYASPADREGLLDRIRTEGRVEFDERFRQRRDGTPVHVVENIVGVFNGGSLVRTQGYIIDDTKRYLAEEELREYAENLRRSNEDLERFAYVSSHDLQEPLRAIVSFSQLLERRYRGQLGTDADEYIDFIVEGGTRMQRLILDLLAYSRVNTTQQAIALTDVTDVLASVGRSLDLQLTEAGATLSRDPMPTVMADPLQVEQVFANLVSNAIKFRRPGVPLRIHIGARRTDDFWEFSVQDNGIGIEPEYYDRIFVIFQRLHTKETYPGTGVGLAIVKRIVERHGGRIRVESTPGEGTTFFFTLPSA